MSIRLLSFKQKDSNKQSKETEFVKKEETIQGGNYAQEDTRRLNVQIYMDNSFDSWML